MARRPDSKFKFGEWLPDQAELDNGGLIEAKNVVLAGGSYQPYRPLLGAGNPINGPFPLAAYRASGGASLLYAAGVSTAGHTLLSARGGGSAWTDVTPVTGLAAAPSLSFTQYRTYVIATTGVGTDSPVFSPFTTTPFTKLTGPFGDAPVAKVAGNIGQFVLLGNLLDAGLLSSPNVLRWCGIDAPLNWPIPNTADAIAQQSSQQALDSRLGAIEGISQGDLWGLVICDGGIVRVTYAGGDVVFQFDPIYRAPATLGPDSWIKAEGRVYSAGAAGFIACDGVNVEKIGYGKVDAWFIANADLRPSGTHCGVDYQRKLIYWTFPLIGNDGIPNHWVAYNYVEKKWTHGDDVIQCYVQGDEAWLTQVGLEALAASGGSLGEVGTLTGTPGTSTIITGEVELNPGGNTLVSGIRPQISGTTRDKITVSDGARDDQTDETPVVYTTGSAIDAFTGQSDFIVDARYHRAKFEIQGAYTKAIGGEFDAQPTSNG